MKAIFTFFSLLFCTYVILAQPITFEMSYGGSSSDGGASIIQAANGTYTLTGHTASSGAGMNDVYLVNIDSAGNELWSSAFGGTALDLGLSVVQASDGGFVVTGHTDNLGAGNGDVYLVKTDASGNIEWSKTFGTVIPQSGSYMDHTSDGGYILTGYSADFGTTIYLIKIDDVGTEQWSNVYSVVNKDFGNCGHQTSDGGFIISGTRKGFTGSQSMIAVKTDSIGDTTWTREIGGSGNDYGLCIIETYDKGFVMIGSTSSFGAGLDDVYLVKLDASGNTLWTKTFGGTQRDEGKDIRQLPDSGFIIIGSNASEGSGLSDLFILRTDKSGTELWSRTYGGSLNDYGSGLSITSDGGYIFTGRTESIGAGMDDAYVIKTDQYGCINPGSDFSVNNTTPFVAGLILFSDLSLSGLLSGSVTAWAWDFGDGNTATTQNPAHSYGLPGTYTVTMIATNSAGCSDTIVKTGYITVTWEGIGISEFENKLLRVSVIPNPFKTSTEIRIIAHNENQLRNLSLKVYDLLGKEMRSFELDNHHSLSGNSITVNFDRDELLAGLYFYKIESIDGLTHAGKLLIR